jgi:hypothetical protein
MQEVNLPRGARYWVEDDGIIHGTESSHTAFKFQDALESIEIIRKLAGGSNVRLLMDISNLSSMERDARAHFAREEHTAWLTAVALIIRSNLSRAIGNLFLGLNKPAVRTRLFTDEDEARAWLRTFQERGPRT